MSAATVKSAPCSPERVLVLFGSPHAEGPTARLTAAALASLPHGTHTLIWNCFETPVLPCDDCGYCRHRAGCSKRDLDGFYAELEEADLLLFATPVYHRSFPAPMKAVLDRLQRYWSARFVLGLRPPIAKPKRGILLTVSGSPSDEGGRLIEQQLAPHLTVLNTTLAGTVPLCGRGCRGAAGRCGKGAVRPAGGRVIVFFRPGGCGRPSQEEGQKHGSLHTPESVYACG